MVSKVPVEKEVFESQTVKWTGKKPDVIYKYLENFATGLGFDIKEGKYKHKRPPGKSEEQEIEWELTRDLDQYTKSVIKISFAGKMAKTQVQEGDKVSEMYVGEMEIKVKGILRTTYEQETFFQKTMFYSVLVAIYEKLFYESIKKKFEDVCVEDAKKIFNEIKAFYSMEPYM